jgi:hypothetical protein
MARVVVSTDVPARVERITAMTEQLERHIGTKEVPSIALLCEATPCAVTLPYGDYELVFTGIADPGRTSSATLHVRAETVVLKHTLGQVRHARGQTAGYALVVTGIILLGVAGGLATSQTLPRASSSTVGGFALAGLGGLALGGVVLAASPTMRQEGATSEFAPPRPVTVGMSIGAKF